MATNPYAPPKGRLTDAVAAAPLWTPSAAGLWCLLLSPIFGSDYERRPWTKIVLVWLADVLVAGFVPGQPASCSSASTEPIRRLG